MPHYQRRAPLTEQERGIIPQVDQSGVPPEKCLEFKMATCDYEDGDGSLLMRGRTAEGKSLQVRLTGFEYYFYLQRQTPFESEEELERTLRELEQVAYRCERVTLPVQGDIHRTEERYGMGKRLREQNPAIRAYAHADGVYRSMYGYSPTTHRIKGIVRVYVQNYAYVRHLAQVIESEEYLNMLAERYPGKAFALRSFGAGMSPDTLFCCRHDVKRGGQCRLTGHVVDPVPIVYADGYYVANYRQVRTIEDPPKPIPVEVMSYDIECIGKPDDRGGMKFPCARPVDPSGGPGSDPVMLIACVQRRYARERGLDFTRAKVLVWPHPKAKEKMRRLRTHERMTRAEFEALPREERQRMGNLYRILDIEEVASEAHLLKAFEELGHAWKPDVVTGWNTNQFDYPYLYNRWVDIWKKGSAADKAVLGHYRPRFGMGIKKESSARWVVKTSKASGTRKFEQVSLPYVLYADGQVVYTNPSFGKQGLSSYKLDKVASQFLVYPGTKRPQRKIKFPLAESMDIWKEGGERMWFFACYCFVDALLPLQLLDHFDKIGLMFALSNLTYCDMNKIYNNGMQVKAVSLIYRASFMYEGGTYLVPDYGRRHLHWPGLFLKPDVRKAVYQYAHQFRTAPEKVTNYPGAKVIVPKAGYYPVPVATDDFASLYPTSARNYALSYDTMLTPEMITHWGVKAHEYTKVPLGPRSLTYCGFATENPVYAKEAGYAESTVMMSYWYNPRGETFFGYIIDLLFKLRKVYKKVLWRWKVVSIILEYEKGVLPTNLDDDVVSTGIIEQVGPGPLKQMRDAVAAGPEAWAALWQKQVDEMMGTMIDNEGEGLVMAMLLSQTGDLGQLSSKLMVNSMYGFTGVPLDKATLPMMMLAAAITAIGRRVLEFTKNVGERINVGTMRQLYDRSLEIGKREGPESAARYRKTAVEYMVQAVEDGRMKLDISAP